MNQIIRRAQIGIALVLISIPLAIPARAAATAPPLLMQAQEALKAAHSWKMTSSGVIGPSAMISVSTVVRQGKILEESIITTVRQANGKKRTTEIVIGAKHTCMRMNEQGAWNCAMPSMGDLLNAATSLNPTISKTAHYTMAPAGTRVEQGQACAGYNVTYTDSGVQTRGTFWVGLASKAPVLLTATGAMDQGKSHPVNITSTIVWSNWNDPRLSIPNVGA